MSKFPRTTIRLAVAGVFSLTLLSACSKTEDTATTSAPAVTTVATAPAAPVEAEDGLTSEQFKAIAEEGFIYGLPIVMNYAIMNEYAIDKNTSQFKASFNHIKNEPRVYTYKDTAVLSPNSDTPY
jgi:hypothetical protein